MTTHETPDDEPDAGTDRPNPETTPDEQTPDAGEVRSFTNRMTRLGHRLLHLAVESGDVVVVHVIALTTIDQAAHLLQLVLR